MSVIFEENDLLISSHHSDWNRFFIKRVRWIESFIPNPGGELFFKRKKSVAVENWPHEDDEVVDVSKIPPTILVCLFSIHTISEDDGEEEEETETESVNRVYKPVLCERYCFHEKLGDFYNEDGEPVIQQLVKFFSSRSGRGKWGNFGSVGTNFVFAMATFQSPFKHVSNPIFFKNFSSFFSLDQVSPGCDFSVIWRDESTKVCIPSVISVENKFTSNFMWKIDESMMLTSSDSISTQDPKKMKRLTIRSKCKISSNEQRDVQYSMERKSLLREIQLRTKISSLESTLERYEQIFQKMSHFEEEEVSKNLQMRTSPSLRKFKREKLKNIVEDEEKWLSTLIRADELTNFDSSKQNFENLIQEKKRALFSELELEEEETKKRIRRKRRQQPRKLEKIYEDDQAELESEEEGESEDEEDNNVNPLQTSSYRLGCFLLTGDQKGYINCWNFMSGMCHARFKVHEDTIHSIRPLKNRNISNNFEDDNPESEFYVSCGMDNWVKLYEHNQNHNKFKLKIQNYKNDVFSPFQTIKKFQIDRKNEDQISSPKCLCEIPNHNLLSIGCLDGRIRFCELQEEEKNHKISISPKWDWVAHQGRVLCLRYLMDDEWLVSCGGDQSILCWDMNTQKLSLGWKKAHQDWVTRLEKCGDKLLVSAGDDSCVKVWDIRSPKKSVAMVRSKALTICDIKCGHGDGSVLVMAHSDGEISIHDVRKLGVEKKRWTAHNPPYFHHDNQKKKLDYKMKKKKKLMKKEKENSDDEFGDIYSYAQENYVEHFVLEMIGTEEECLFVSGSKDKKLKLWNLEGKCLKEIDTGSEIRCILNPCLYS